MLCVWKSDCYLIDLYLSVFYVTSVNLQLVLQHDNFINTTYQARRVLNWQKHHRDQLAFDCKNFSMLEIVSKLKHLWRCKTTHSKVNITLVPEKVHFSLNWQAFWNYAVADNSIFAMFKCRHCSNLWKIKCSFSSVFFFHSMNAVNLWSVVSV
jgi:hypothetical protein